MGNTVVKFCISCKKEKKRNVILHYLKMIERKKERGCKTYSLHQKGAWMLFLFSDRIGKNIQHEE